MKSTTRIFLTLAALAIGLLAAETASAQSPLLFGYGYGNWGSYGDSGWRTLPYFAEHPPVYYSHPIPRPYGFSPYATPPFLLPAELQVTQPQAEEIINPYFRPKSDDAEDSQEGVEATGAHREKHPRTAQRRVIVNPYVPVSRAARR